MDIKVVEYILNELGADNIIYSGNNYLKCNCLFAKHTDEHKSDYDNKPSMYINYNLDDTFIYGCFTCSNKSNGENLIKKLSLLNNKDYSYLLKYLPKKSNDFIFDRKKSLIKKDIVFTRKIIEKNNNFKDINDFKLPLKYCISRNINSDTIKKAELVYDNYEKRIVFPVKGLNNELYGYTSRSCLPDKYFPKFKLKVNKQWDFKNIGNADEVYKPYYISDDRKIDITYEKIRDYKGLKKSQCILGVHLWSKNKPNFIVEGLFGYLHLLSIGADEFFNIGCTMGANLSDHQAKILIDYKAPTYLLFDNDEAGKKALYGIHNSNNQKKGAIDKLENKIILFIPKWPKVNDDDLIIRLNLYKDSNYVNINNNWYKADPETLTLDDLKYMKLKSDII